MRVINEQPTVRDLHAVQLLETVTTDKINALEAGKVLSTSNESVLKKAVASIVKMLKDAGISLSDDDTEDTDAKEALSHTDISSRLQRALVKQQIVNSDYAYIRDIYPSFLVYQGRYNGYTYSCWAVQYSIDDTTKAVTFGAVTEVIARTIYENTDGTTFEGSEAAKPDTTEITTDTILLTEATKEKTTKGTVRRAKLIAPGHGSSGYYSEALLKSSAAKFAKGTHINWDHPTAEDEKKRPEGSLSSLAGVLESDGEYLDDPTEGKGIYAKIRVYPGYDDKVDAMASDIGMSIRASGLARTSEIAGKKTPVIEQITKVSSVDFVTRAGAGGKVLALFESAKQIVNTIDDEEINMGKLEDLETQLAEANKNIGVLTSSLQTLVNSQQQVAIAESAKPHISAKLRSYNLPRATKETIARNVLGKLPVKEGLLDTAALETLIASEASTQASYLSSLGIGRVRGMGNTNITEAKDESVEDLTKEIDSLLA